MVLSDFGFHFRAWTSRLVMKSAGFVPAGNSWMSFL
jgi:hypothetical protein